MKSLRTKLFLWYLGSLLFLAVFFYVFVHILALPNSTEYFIFLIAILATLGFVVVYRVNELMVQLRQSLMREQQFIADVAHELKTPLATLRASLELAGVKGPIREIDRLSNTLKDVLELAWTETPVRQQPKKMDLSALMEELTEIAAKMGQIKNISVVSTIDKDIKIIGFREKLARAIINVIDNAIKYSPEDSQVEISLEKVKNKALIVVKDNGRGIAKGELLHIFDRFYRSGKADNVFGSGLGLAISKSIIQLHHGEIKVKSSADGSTFAVVLPIHS